MATPTPTTELDAVNVMLTAVGVTPVNTLAVSGLTDAAIAYDTLLSTSKEVQSRGWYFNRYNYVQHVPAAGKITIPATILKIKPAEGTYTLPREPLRFALRNGELWDLDANASINVAVRADQVQELEFENLPETARRAIAVRAARIFQTQILGDEAMGVFTEAHEAEAWAALEMDEGADVEGTNTFMTLSRLQKAQLISDPPKSNDDQQRQYAQRSRR